MKTKLLLLSLLTLYSTLGWAQSSGNYNYPVRWFKNGNAMYFSTVRDYSVYPGTAQGDASFLSAVGSGAIAQKPRIGPDWIDSVDVTYSANLADFEIEAATSANVQVMIERQDGQAMNLGNVDNASLNSATYYGPGPLTNRGGYKWGWVFEKRYANGVRVPSSGVQYTSTESTGPVVAVKLSFKNTDTGEVYVHTVKAFDHTSRSRLFVSAAAAAGTPIASTTGDDPYRTTDYSPYTEGTYYQKAN